MEWIAGEVRKSVNPRTYVLLGVLALALAWAVSEKGRPRHHAPTFGAAAALATTSAPLAEPTPAVAPPSTAPAKTAAKPPAPAKPAKPARTKAAKPKKDEA